MRNRRVALVLVSVILGMYFGSGVSAQMPQFDCVIETNDEGSVEWFDYRDYMTHLYGNFSISLCNLSYVEQVQIRIGERNESDSFEVEHWTIYYNSSTEPYEWVLDTTDFPVGPMGIHIRAFNYGYDAHHVESKVTHYSGVTITLYLEHEDKSGEALLSPPFSVNIPLEIIIASGAIGTLVILMLYLFYKTRTAT